MRLQPRFGANSAPQNPLARRSHFEASKESNKDRKKEEKERKERDKRNGREHSINKFLVTAVTVKVSHTAVIFVRSIVTVAVSVTSP